MSSVPPEPTAWRTRRRRQPHLLEKKLVGGLIMITLVVVAAHGLLSQHLMSTSITLRTEQTLNDAWQRAQWQISAQAGGSVSMGAPLTARGADLLLPSSKGHDAGTLVGLLPLEGKSSSPGADAWQLPVEAFIVDEHGDQRDLDDDERHALYSAIAGGDPETPTRLEVHDESYLVRWGGLDLDTRSAAPDALLVVGVSAGRDAAIEELSRRWLIGMVIAMVLVLAGGARWWVRRSLRGLATVTQQAEAVARLPMARGTVDLREHRIPEGVATGSGEIGVMGEALNTMIDSVDDALVEREETDRRLRRFVADASHELRTPLASMRGYADMLALTEPLTPKGQESLARVRAQTDRMSALVEDMLLLARLDRIAMSDSPTTADTGERVRVDVGEIVLEAVQDASAASPERRWKVDVSDEVLETGAEVLADRSQLERVLANLLSNAAKHTPAGTNVTVHVDRDALEPCEDGECPAVRIVVHDDGPGIPEEVMPRLFDRFVRGSAGRTSTEGSTGLGLSIVKAVIQAHGGRIQVSSVPGDTRFVAVLPACE